MTERVIRPADDGGPLIGISAYREFAGWGSWRQDAAVLPYAYVEQVARAGGVPMLLPPLGIPRVAQVAAAAVAPLHALVVSGGPDVDPRRYDAQPHPQTVDVRPERDAWELALLGAALERDIPVLAICRGAQLLNVACGGTLLQHLPDAVGHDGHRPAPEEDGPAAYARVEVALETDALPGRLLGRRISVPCYHHQAVGALGRDLILTGRALDGTVEAIELAGRAFVVGVQWHPEVDADTRLFDALIAAARVGASEGERV